MNVEVDADRLVLVTVTNAGHEIWSSYEAEGIGEWFELLWGSLGDHFEQFYCFVFEGETFMDSESFGILVDDLNEMATWEGALGVLYRVLLPKSLPGTPDELDIEAVPEGQAALFEEAYEARNGRGMAFLAMRLVQAWVEEAEHGTES